MSLIGCHTLAGTGIEYPEKKPTWRYIKGDEKDFEGAPNWALYRDVCCGKYFWSEGYSVGDRFKCVNVDNVCAYEGNEMQSVIIAQRERVTSINDDRLVQALIAERGSRYGKFADGAEIMQYLKSFIHQTEGWSRLTTSQREALDMIQHKIGRVLNGDPNYDDNWKDIAGYATLIVEELNGVKSD